MKIIESLRNLALFLLCKIVYNTLHMTYVKKQEENDMVPRSSLIIRVLAGGYITYLGGKLLLSSIKEQPDNYILYVAAGIVFIIIGLIWLVKSGLKLFKKEYEDDSVMGQLNKDEGVDTDKVVEDDDTAESAAAEGTEDAAVNAENKEMETDKKETIVEEK